MVTIGSGSNTGGETDTIVTPWIPPYNLPKDEYCAWRVKLSVEGGHKRAHFLENPWLWCGCSKKGAANRGTFLEASDDPQNARDAKVACQGDNLRDGLLPRSEKCAWIGHGSDRELPPETNPDGVPTMCVPSPKYAAQYGALRIATPTWKQSFTIPASAHTIVTPYAPTPNLPHDRYCDERLKILGGALTQFMENPWMFCGCRVSKNSATGVLRSAFIEDGDGAPELCTGKRLGLPESASPRSSKCDWAGAGEHGNPDSVDTVCIPKPEFVNLYAELRKLQASEGAAASSMSASSSAGDY